MAKCGNQYACLRENATVMKVLIFSIFRLALLTADMGLGVFGSPVISLPIGDLEGSERYVINSSAPVYEFLGIPYAQAPEGSLRFKDPQPHKGWNGTWDATQFRSLCMQSLDEPLIKLLNFKAEHFSEDCLFLNIYSPNLNSSKPVLFSIHGGGLTMGAAATYNGTALSGHEDIVIVTAAYRVGALGFLTTQDGSIPPNLGLRDQQAALQWVRDYISYFGGDPKQVTIFGESAGAYSVNFHLLSPVSKPLFHRAIHESGSLFNFRTVNHDPQSSSDELAKRLNCSDVAKLVECLGEQQAGDIITAQAGIRWTVSKDPQNIPGDPIDLFTSGLFTRVPNIFLVMSIEGAEFLPPDVSEAKTLTRENFFSEVRRGLGRYNVKDEKKVEQAVKSIADFYLGNQTGTTDFYKRKLADEIGDLRFMMPSTQNARQYHKYATVYFGVFSHRRSNSPWPAWMDGATHTDAIPFIYGRDLLESTMIDYPVNVTFDETDRELSRAIMRYIGNFVRGGDPNSDNLTLWPMFKQPNEEYMDFSSVASVKRGFQPDPAGFLWNTTHTLIESADPVITGGVSTSATLSCFAYSIVSITSLLAIFK